MADLTAVLSAFRLELVNAGIVRRASAAGNVPPMLIEPSGGARAPGEAEDPVEDDANLVLSLFHSGTLSPASNYDAALARGWVLDVRYRTRPDPGANGALRAANALDEEILNRLVRPATNYGYGFMLGGELWVQRVGVYGGLSRISSSRERGHDLVSKWLVEVAP